MNTFEELYQHNVKIDDEYDNIKNRVKQYYDILKKSLSDYELNILDKLIENHYKMSGKENMYFFINGFKHGMSVDFNSTK